MTTKQAPTNEHGWTADQTVEAVREQSRQFTQQEADYQQDEGTETKRCELCFFWQGGGQCQVVGGQIAAAGLSDLYINKEQQDAAMGEDENMSKNSKRETKAFSTGECKVLDEALGIVEHLVAVFGNLDLGDDIIHPGAFTKTIVERGRKVKVVDSHNYNSALDAVGTPLQLWEVDRAGLPLAVLAEFPTATGGLMAKTQFLMDTPEGKGIFARIKAGAIDQYSIGYDALDSDMSKVTVDGQERTVRNLRTIKLYEYSPVVFAMNEATATLDAKHKAVTGFQDAALSPRERAWDASAAERRVRAWAGGEDAMDWLRYRKAFFWYDQDNQEEFGGYKFPYADIVSGELTAIPRGVFAGAGRLDGSSIPDADKTGIQRQMGRYYAKMREEFDDDSLVPPWEKSQPLAVRYKAFIEKYDIPPETGGELQQAIMDYLHDRESKAGRVLSAANAGRISSALLTLMDVLERAGIDIPGFDTAAAHEDDEEEKTPLQEMAQNITVNISSQEALKEFVELLASQDVTKSPYAPLLPSPTVFERFTQLTIDGMDRPSAYFQAVMEQAELATKETPAPEKAADNEHQAGPVTPPTSDDVLTHIRLLELDLQLQEV